MYVLLERPGQPSKRIQVMGDEVVIGRAPSCDVVIEEEFVSKQHLRILSGLVAVDVSSNGTFLNGQRIQGGVVLAGRPLQIADSDITLRIELDEVAVATPSVPVPAAPRTDPAVAKQATMLQEQLEAAAKRLQAKSDACKALEAELKGSASAVAEAAKEIATLHLAVAALHQEMAELEAKAGEPTPPTDGSAAGLLLFNVQRENTKLKRALAEQKAAVAAEAAKLSVAQRGVASHLAAAKAKARAPDTLAPAAVQAKPTTAMLGAAPPAKPGKAALPFGDPIEPLADEPAGVNSAVTGSADLNTSRLLELLQQDADAMTVRPEDPLDAFLLVEGFRFLRRMERVITRLAGGLIQLYQNQTMVPGVGGNLRQLLAEIAAHPDKPHVRAELLNYLQGLGRWLVVALSAYRKAAEDLAVQIKDELTAEALTASDPISMVKRATGKSDAELWRRVCEHMKTLSKDEIIERVEKLAREAADELTKGDDDGSFR
ncbi:MAG: hypothetical protein ACI85K_000432 [Hyphomicrobiaceae bacterium]